MRYEGQPFPINAASVAGDHPLTERLSTLRMISKNSLPIHLETGETLAELGGVTALGLEDYGVAGVQVLALSDLGSLDLYDFQHHERDNFTFLRNLARCARERH
jgi:hypothetical protein